MKKALKLSVLASAVLFASAASAVAFEPVYFFDSGNKGDLGISGKEFIGSEGLANVLVDGVVEFNSINISNNKLLTGLYVQGNVEVSGRAEFVGNKQPEEIGDDSNGAPALMVEVGSVQFNGEVLFKDNTNAHNSPGAVYVGNGTEVEFNGGGEFIGNSATNGAAGAFLNLGNTVFNGDYVFEKNKAASGYNDMVNLGGNVVVQSGSVVFNSGVRSTKHSESGSFVVNKGAAVRIGLDSAVKADSSFETLTLGAGEQTGSTVFEVGNAAVDVGTMTVEGNAEVFVSNENAALKVGSKTGEGKVMLHASGSVNDAVNGDAKEFGKKVKGGDYKFAGTEFFMDEGAVVGAVSGTVGDDGVFTVVTEEVNHGNQAIHNKVDSSRRVLTAVVGNDLRKRLGEVRDGGNGAWARISGGEMSGDYSLESDFMMVQVGADAAVEGTNMRLGGAFSYATADTDDKFGSADFNAYSVAGYGVWTNEHGQFADVVARYTRFDTDLVDRGVSADLANNAFSFSAEFGWRFDLAESAFVEPSVELAYTHFDGDGFNTEAARYDFSSVNSLQGRAGFMAGLKCPNNFGNVYVRAALVHEFDGDSELDASSRGGSKRTIGIEGKDTWVEYAVGANFNIGSASQVYVDVERTSASDYDEDWRASAGFRYNF